MSIGCAVEAHAITSRRRALAPAARPIEPCGRTNRSHLSEPATLKAISENDFSLEHVPALLKLGYSRLVFMMQCAVVIALINQPEDLEVHSIEK